MFYLLSKIIGLFINPMVWIVGLLIAVVFIKKPKLKNSLIIVSLAFTFLFSNSFLLNELLLKWEKPPVKNYELLNSYDYGIVLSGMVWFDKETGHINFLQSSDRIWQAVRLYKENRIQKILISGGAADLFKQDSIESVLLKNFLIKVGIPAHDIVTEESSRNTWENAINTAQLLDSQPDAKLLLITSAIHMRRAMACFAKAGVQFDIYPTDHYSSNRQYNISNFLIPNARSLFNWNAFIHELFGMISYKMAGYI